MNDDRISSSCDAIEKPEGLFDVHHDQLLPTNTVAGW